MVTLKMVYNELPGGVNTWQDLGISPALFLTEADYYGAIEYKGDYYIVLKGIKGKKVFFKVKLEA